MSRERRETVVSTTAAFFGTLLIAGSFFNGLILLGELTNDGGKSTSWQEWTIINALVVLISGIVARNTFREMHNNEWYRRAQREGGY